MERSPKRLRRDNSGSVSDTVTFNVGGRCFEVLTNVVQSRPSTLLFNLIDDIGTDAARPIFVDANPDRFQHILDWYRYGEMYVLPSCSLPAILRDARYFMLPEPLKINGKMHMISSPSTSDVHARNGPEMLRAQVISKWPNFHAYVKQLARETLDEFEERGKTSDQTRHHRHGGRGAAGTRLVHSDPFNGRSVVLARPSHSRSACEWIDEENVCNEDRLQVLIDELLSLGFICNLHHSDFNISLQIHAPQHTRDSDECTRVKIEGVDVYRSRSTGRTCLAVLDEIHHARYGSHGWHPV